MGVEVHGGSFEAVEVAAQHCDELHCIFECVDADERGVAPCVGMSQRTGLHGGQPFKVPPKPGCRAVASYSCEAGVTVCNAARDSGYEVCAWAGLGGLGGGQCLLNLVEVMA